MTNVVHEINRAPRVHFKFAVLMKLEGKPLQFLHRYDHPPYIPSFTSPILLCKTYRLTLNSPEIQILYAKIAIHSTQYTVHQGIEVRLRGTMIHDHNI